MAVTWNEIAGDDRFKKASKEQQMQLAEKYYKDVVTKTIPVEKQTPDLFNNFMQRALSVSQPVEQKPQLTVVQMLNRGSIDTTPSDYGGDTYKGINALRPLSLPVNAVAGVLNAMTPIKPTGNTLTGKDQWNHLVTSFGEAFKEDQDAGDVFAKNFNDYMVDGKSKNPSYGNAEDVTNALVWTLAGFSLDPLLAPMGKVFKGTYNAAKSLVGEKTFQKSLSNIGVDMGELESRWRIPMPGESTKAYTDRLNTRLDTLGNRITYEAAEKKTKPIMQQVDMLVDDLDTRLINQFHPVEKATTQGAVDFGKRDIPKTEDIFFDPKKNGMSKESIETSIKNSLGEGKVPEINSFKNPSKIADKDNPIYLLQRHLDSTGRAKQIIVQDFKPIVMKIKDDYKDFNKYAISRRAIATEKYLGENPIVKSIFGTYENAKYEFKNLVSKTSPETIKKWDTVYKELNDFRLKQMSNLHESGVISKEMMESFKKNPDYIPLVLDKVSKDVVESGIVRPKKLKVSKKDIRQTIRELHNVGSEVKIVNPLESLVSDTYRIEIMANANKAKKAFFDIAKSSEILSERLKDVSATRSKKNIVSYFENGEMREFSVPDDIYIAFNGMSTTQLSAVAKFFRYPTKVFRSLATSANPEFSITNIARDTLSAYYNSERGWTTITGIDLTVGLLDEVRSVPLFKQFLRDGGEMSTFVARDRASNVKNFKNVIGEKDASFLKNAQNAANTPLEALQWLSQKTELPYRYQEYKKILARGGSREEAMMGAKNVTANFSRTGRDMARINGYYAFLNANIQGKLQLVETTKKHPLRSVIRMTPLVGTGIALWNHNNAYEGYNNETIVSSATKMNNFVFMTSDTSYVKIPKSDIGKAATNFTEYYLEWLKKSGKKQELFETLINPISDFSPVSTLMPITSQGDLLPTSIRPMFEDLANYSFFRKSTIVSPFDESKPESAKFNRSTSELSILLGDKIETSPARIDHYISSYLPGLPITMWRGLDTFLAPEEREYKKAGVSDIVGVRKLYKDVSDREDQTSIFKKRAYDKAESDYNRNKGSIKNNTSLSQEEKEKYIGKILKQYNDKLEELNKRYGQ